MCSIEHKIDRLQQYMGFFAKNCEVFLRLCSQNTHAFAGAVYPQKGNKIGFSCGIVSPQRFANRVLITCSIE